MTMKAFYGVLFALIMVISVGGAEGKGAKEFTFSPIMGLDVEYTDNAFELDDDDKDRVQHPDQKDIDNGRVFGMDAACDLIYSPQLGFSLILENPFGSPLYLSPWVENHIFNKNPEKTYTEISISLDHAVEESGRFLWSLTYVSDYFKSNELYKANDENDNGNIAGDERVYAPAVYDEYETVLTHTFQLYKNKHGLLSKVDVEPEIGAIRRTYKDIFKHRDRTVFFAAIKLKLEWWTDLTVGLFYRHDTIESSNGKELVLYDETMDGSDINGDGSIARNAALLTQVDRSCRMHALGIRPRWALSKKLAVFAGYEWRTCKYLSHNVLDESHYGETEIRQKVSAGMSCDLTRLLSLELSGTHIDEDAEKNDGYTEKTLSLQVSYRLP